MKIRFHTHNSRIVTTTLVLSLALTVMMVPELAHAQAGGGSGQAAGLISWAVSTIGKPMLYAGIIMVAFFMLCARISLGVVGMVAAGGLVFANYGAIAAFFSF